MRSWRRWLVASVVAGVTALAGAAAADAASNKAASDGAAGNEAAGGARKADLVQLGYQLVNVNSSKCLTVTAAGLADGAILVQKVCTREAADRWRFVHVGGAGLYLVENVNSGKCLAVADGSLADNGFAVQGRCDSGLAAQWLVRKVEGAALPILAKEALLENGLSHRCLTIAGGSAAENGVAVQYACDGAASRRWSMRLVAGPALDGTDLDGTNLDATDLGGPPLGGAAL